MKRKRKSEPVTEELPPSLLLEIFDEPIIAQRWAVRATGSITAAVMISYALVVSQMLDEKQDGWFSKTIKEWEESVGLSRSELETARQRLTELGLLQERRVGMPARLEYRVDQEQVYCAISEAARRFEHVDRREQARLDAREPSRPPRQPVPPLCSFPPGYTPL